MTKIITILILIASTFVSYANKSIESTYDELKLIQSFKDEKLITQQQFLNHQNRIQSKLSKTTNHRIQGFGTAVISGHIQDDSAVALETHLVYLYEIVSDSQQFKDSTYTNASGNYTFNDLPAGNYTVHSGDVVDDYLNYLWNPVDLILCTNQRCIVPVTSHIALADAAVINNIDFTTKLGGKVTGNISDAASMLAVTTLKVAFINNDPIANGSYSLTSLVDAVTGNFSINGIPDGDYRMYLYPNGDYLIPNLHIPQIYGGAECNACGRLIYQGAGATLTINMANTINSIDFAVNVGASISGILVDNDTSNPLQEYGLVMLFNEFNHNLVYLIIYGTNLEPTADGTYTVGGLLPGSYYVQGGDLGREFYQRELYNNRPCYYGGCDRGNDGDPIVLGAGVNIAGIDFLLNKGGKISGTVTDSLTGMPIVQDSFNRLWVEFYDASQNVIGSSIVREDGTYIAARSLPVGSYAVRTGSMFQGNLSAPYVNEKYNDIQCAGIACDLTTADITVALETTTENIDFALTTGNSFDGIVTDLATSAPIGGVHVLVYKEMGPGVVKFANWATTVSDGPGIGTFEVSGLPDGTYYARTGYGSDLPFLVSAFHNIGGTAPVGWIDILYDNMPCLAGCDVTTGTPIVLPTVLLAGAGTGPTIDFSLTQGGIITGQTKDFIDNAPLKEITINVYNDQGTFMGSSITDDDGNYITRGLPIGTYYLTTTSFEVLLDVKFGNQFCTASSCNPLEADPITISSLQQEVSNRDFILKTAYMHMFSDAFE